MIHCSILLDFLYELYYDAQIHKHQSWNLLVVAVIMSIQAKILKGMSLTRYMKYSPCTKLDLNILHPTLVQTGLTNKLGNEQTCTWIALK